MLGFESRWSARLCWLPRPRSPKAPWSTAPKAARKGSSRSSSPPARPSMRCRCRCSTGWSSFRSAPPTSCRRWPNRGRCRPTAGPTRSSCVAGVKFHSNANFNPTRDFNADDVLFSWNRMADENHPFHKMTAGQTFSYYDDMGMKNIVDKVEKLDDADGALRPEAARKRRFSPTWPWTSPRSCRRSTSRPCRKRARRTRPTSTRSAPARSSSSPTRRTRPSATRRSTSIGAAGPRSTT